MKSVRKRFTVSVGLLAAFVVWTVIVCLVDVRPIGPGDTCVGLAGLNRFVHGLTRVHFVLYHITDWLGLVPVGVGMGFAALGLAQWIKRKRIGNVDFNLLVLGGFYLVTAGVYLLFEGVVINYRPVLINGHLEASYPSSTTLLVLCVMSTTLLQCNQRIRSRTWRRLASLAIIVFMAFMVIGRLVSGVHWFTDIVGGALLSGGLVTMYDAVSHLPQGNLKECEGEK